MISSCADGLKPMVKQDVGHRDKSKDLSNKSAVDIISLCRADNVLNWNGKLPARSLATSATESREFTQVRKRRWPVIPLPLG